MVSPLGSLNLVPRLTIAAVVGLTKMVRYRSLKSRSEYVAKRDRTRKPTRDREFASMLYVPGMPFFPFSMISNEI